MLLCPTGCLPAGGWGWLTRLRENRLRPKYSQLFLEQQQMCSQPLTWHMSEPACLYSGLGVYTWLAGPGSEPFAPRSGAASNHTALAACPAPGQGSLQARDILLALPQCSRCCPASANPSLLPTNTAPARAAMHPHDGQGHCSLPQLVSVDALPSSFSLPS